MNTGHDHLRLVYQSARLAAEQGTDCAALEDVATVGALAEAGGMVAAGYPGTFPTTTRYVGALMCPERRILATTSPSISTRLTAIAS